MCSRTSLSLQFNIHTPVRSSTGTLARLKAPLRVPFRLFALSSLYSSSHSAQPVFALVVGVQISAVALFAGNRCLFFFGTRGPPCRRTYVCGPPLTGRRRLPAST